MHHRVCEVFVTDKTDGQPDRIEGYVPPTPWDHRDDSLVRRALGYAGIDSWRILFTVAAWVTVALLTTFVVQYRMGVFGDKTSPQLSQSAELADPPPPLPAEEADPLCDVGHCYEPGVTPPVTVILGKEKFAKLDGSMLSNLFCLDPMPIGIDCDPAKHQRILRQVLTNEQLGFLDKHNIDSNIGDWEFIDLDNPISIGWGVSEKDAASRPDKPSQSYDEMVNSVVLINP